MDPYFHNLLTLRESKLKVFKIEQTATNQLIGLGSDGNSKNIRSIITSENKKSVFIINEEFDFIDFDLATGMINKILRPFDGRFPLIYDRIRWRETDSKNPKLREKNYNQRQQHYFTPDVNESFSSLRSLFYKPKNLLPNGEMIMFVKHSNLITDSAKGKRQFSQMNWGNLIRMNIHSTTQNGNHFENAEVLASLGSVLELELHQINEASTSDTNRNTYRVWYMTQESAQRRGTVEYFDYHTSLNHEFIRSSDSDFPELESEKTFKMDKIGESKGVVSMKLTMTMTQQHRPSQSKHNCEEYCVKQHLCFPSSSKESVFNSMAVDSVSQSLWFTFVESNRNTLYLAKGHVFKDLSKEEFMKACEEKLDLEVSLNTFRDFGSLKFYTNTSKTKKWLIYQNTNLFRLVDISNGRGEVVISKSTPFEIYNLTFSTEKQLLFWSAQSSLMVYSLQTKSEMVNLSFPYLINAMVVNEHMKTLTLYPKEKEGEVLFTEEYSLDSFRKIRDLDLIDPVTSKLIFYYEPSTSFDFAYLFQKQSILLCQKPSYKYLASYLNFPSLHLRNLLFSKYDPSSLAVLNQFFQNKVLQDSFQFDTCLGPMNPYILAVHFNDPSTLTQFLSSFGYPQICEQSYLGILEFASRLQRRECVSALQRYLIEKKSSDIVISYRDFLTLLRSNSIESHNAVSTVFCSDQLGIIPSIRQQASSVDIQEESDVLSLVSTFTKTDKPQNKTANKREAFSQANKLSKSSSYTERFVSTSQLPFTLNTEIGSQELLEFTNIYAVSSSEELINSDFKYLVNLRFDTLWILHFVSNLVFFIFAAFFVLHAVFYKDDQMILAVTMAITGILVVWEIIQVIAGVVLLGRV